MKLMRNATGKAHKHGQSLSSHAIGDVEETFPCSAMRFQYQRVTINPKDAIPHLGTNDDGNAALGGPSFVSLERKTPHCADARYH